MLLFDEQDVYACSSATRFWKFRDPLIMNETSSFVKLAIHIRTIDLAIIQHPAFWDTFEAQGLNHIPLCPTIIEQVTEIESDAF